MRMQVINSPMVDYNGYDPRGLDPRVERTRLTP